MSEREILFRGKRCDNGEWVEGLPIKTYDTELGTEIGKNSADYSKPVPVVLMASGRIVLECGYDEIPFFNIDEYPIVNPETISQYTGLTDKNGVRIFERDIIDVAYNPNYGGVAKERIGTFKVGFEDGRYVYEDGEGYFLFTESDEIIVIGNIHDNPELLKGE